MTLKRGITHEIISAIDAVEENIASKTGMQIKLDLAPRIELGDYSIECFSMAKIFQEKPVVIAEKIAKAINKSNITFYYIAEARNDGPYVNIRLTNQALFESACSSFLSSVAISHKKERVMVEYLSPNTNKPLHLGHARNGFIGMSISNLLEATGAMVIKANLINDRGVHICKSMLAYNLWGNNETPESTSIKGDHFVGDFYVKFEEKSVIEKNNPQKQNHNLLEKRAQEMLVEWENGTPSVIELWKKMNQWVNDGFSETYKKLGLIFDKIYFESNTYKLGKDIIEEGLAKGIFFKSQDGTIVYKLPKEDFGANKDGSLKEYTVLRSDGTSVYITQDIGTAVEKALEFNLDRSIYVVGDEQKYHFHCLFSILKAMKYKWANGCHHLAYGMITLPDGKMKSREGKIVDIDDLINEMINLARTEILKRSKEEIIRTDELEERASIIGLGAMKFFLLRTKPVDWIEFDPEKSISFEGKTGPYCQYSYARSSGIMRKINKIDQISDTELDFSLLGNREERILALKMIEFPEIVEKASNELDPSTLARYLYDLAKILNSFYEKHPVLKADKQIKRARYELIKSFAQILKEGLGILDIKTLERM